MPRGASGVTERSPRVVGLETVEKLSLTNKTFPVSASVPKVSELGKNIEPLPNFLVPVFTLTDPSELITVFASLSL